MKGLVKNYRRGHRTMNANQIIVIVDNVTKKADAQKLVGKKAVWATKGGKNLTGTVLGVHGDKGAIRVRFETPLPPQSLGTPIEIRA